MNNPLFKAGIKPGIHHIGQGVEKKIRIRSIRSPQALVTDSKVKKMKRKNGKMPPIVVSHAGHGSYLLKDGNNRAVAALLSGKRKILAMVQRMQSKLSLLRFAEDDLQPHQKRAIKRFLEPGRPGLILAHGLGSGKTRSAIEIHKAYGGTADVVVPAALRQNYTKEVERWGGDLSKTNLISQQNVSLKGRRALKNPLLIVDESHKGRNPKAKLSDAIKGSSAQKRLLLSGTPLFNQSSDIATLVNQAAGRNVIREGKAFEKRYLNPGFIGRLRGKRLSHEGELQGILKKYVDYHKGDPSVLPKVEAKVVPVEMTPHQSKLYRATISGIPRGLPSIQAKNIQRLSPYLTGARQVSNTARAIDPSSNDEPKIDRIVSDLEQHLKNPKGKALIYSNWLEHGIRPIQKRLEGKGIPHGVFTGEETEKARNQAVSDYNSDKLRALIVSSSGTEGLDLKGTRLVQVAEPHFNNAKLRQVVGRSARIGSHTDLPEGERKVEVRQYIARPKRRFFGGHKKGVEDLLSEAARDKDETDRQITRLFKSKMKLIQFGGKYAKRYLVGSALGETDVGRQLVDVVTQEHEPAGQIRTNIAGQRWRINAPLKMKSGKESKVQKISRMVEARDLRNYPGYADFKVAHGLGGEAKGLPTVESARDAVAKVLRTQHKLMIASGTGARKDFDLHGLRQTRKALDIKVSDLAGKMKNEEAPALWKGLHAKMVERGMNPQTGIAGLYSADTPEVRLRRITSNAENSLRATLAVSPTVPKKFPKKGDKLQVKNRPDAHYRYVAEQLGEKPSAVRKLHHQYKGLANPDEAALAQKLIKQGPINAATKAAQAAVPYTGKFPILKTAGIGAGLVGVGLLAKKLFGRKKTVLPMQTPDDSRDFSAIEFAWPGPGRGKRFLKFIPKPTGMSKVKAEELLRSTIPASGGLSSGGVAPSDVEDARRVASMLGGMLRVHKNAYWEGFKASNPGARYRAIHAAKANTKDALRTAGEYKTRAERADEALGIATAQHKLNEAKHLNEYTEATNQRTAEHEQKVKGIRSSYRKKIGIGVGIGALGGATVGYRARKPDDPLEFASKFANFIPKRSISGPSIGEKLANKYRKLPTGGKIGLAIGALTGFPLSGTAIGAGTEKILKKALRPVANLGKSVMPRTKIGRAREWQFAAETINKPGNTLVKTGFKVHKTGQYIGYGGTAALGTLAASKALFGTETGQKIVSEIGKRSAKASSALNWVNKTTFAHKGKIVAAGLGLLGVGAATKGIGNRMIRTGFESRGDRLKRRAAWQISQLKDNAINAARGAVHSAAVGFASRDDKPKASILAHAATGGLEGAAGIYAVEPLLERFQHGRGTVAGNFRKTLNDSLRGHLKKIAIGGAVGAAATAPIGWLVEKYRGMTARRRNEMKKPIEFSRGQRVFALFKRENRMGPGPATLLKAINERGGEYAKEVARSARVTKRFVKTPELQAAAAMRDPNWPPNPDLKAKTEKLGEDINAALRGPSNKPLLIGAGLAAAATGGGIYAYSKALKRRREERRLSAIEFQAPISRGAVTRDRYLKQIKEGEQQRKESNYLRSGLTGAAIGALFKGKKGALIGAGGGLLTQAAVRGLTNEKDIFKEEEYNAKRIQKLPWQLGGVGAAALLGKKAFDKFRMTRGKFFSSRKKLIQFADEDPYVGQQMPPGFEAFIRPKTKNRRPRTLGERLQRKWLGGAVDKEGNAAPVNVSRRAQDLGVYARRTKGVFRDIKGLIKGEPALDERGRPRKREFDKPWVKAAIGGALLGGGLALSGSIRKAASSATAATGLTSMREVVQSGALGRYVEKKVPFIHKAYTKIMGAPGQLDKEVSGAMGEGNAINRGLNKLARHIREGAGDIKPSAHPDQIRATIPKYGDVIVEKGSQAYNWARRKTMTQAQRAAEDALKAQEGGIIKGIKEKKKWFGSRAKLIQFVNKNEYDDLLDNYRDLHGLGYRHYQGDRKRQWEKLAPHVVQRERRPRRFTETEFYDDAILKPGIAVGAGLSGVAYGTWKARPSVPPHINIDPDVGVASSPIKPTTKPGGIRLRPAGKLIFTKSRRPIIKAVSSIARLSAWLNEVLYA